MIPHLLLILFIGRIDRKQLPISINFNSIPDAGYVPESLFLPLKQALEAVVRGIRASQGRLILSNITPFAFSRDQNGPPPPA
jgi:hypothetical protein